MNLQAFLYHIKNSTIPPEPPEYLISGGGYHCRFGNNSLDYWRARDECTRRGMWAIVDQIWTQQLAGWIGSRKVLEVMAGAGWLAKALNEAGNSIVATDDYSWDGSAHANMKRVFDVQKMHSLEAVIKIEADILLVSWPPYEDETITTTCRLWGNDRPIVYIGEGQGGCNAPDSFWQGFRPDEDSPKFSMVSWDGLHDCITIGYWCENK